MSRRTKPKNSEETPVAPDVPSATQNITADQAGTSSDHEDQHTSESSSDKSSADSPLSEAKPQNRASGSKTIKEVPTEKLKPHPLSSKIYTPKISGGLVASVQEHGILVPLLVTPETNEVIAGNSRLEAAKQAGLLKVPVIYFGSSDELEIRQAILETNNQREKNTEQKLREYLEWLDIEREGGKRRMATNSAKGGVYNGTQADNGKSRDKAALKIGMSGLHADRGGQVVQAIDKLNSKGDNTKAKELTEKLNGRSINAAYNLAVESGIIVKAKKTTSKPKTVTTTTPKVPKMTVLAASVKEVESSEAAAGVESEQQDQEDHFTVSTHDKALEALSSVREFARKLKAGKTTEYWRPKYVDSINALTESLLTAGLVLGNSDLDT